MFFPSTIQQHESIAEGIYSLILSVPAGFDPRPGQFVMVQTGDRSRLLPRPISICETRTRQKILRFVIRVAGAGTASFSSSENNDRIRLTGPLGNGFDTGAGFSHHLLVGGGVGVPPLLSLAKDLKKQKKGRVTAVLGFRDMPFLTEDFEKYCDDIYIASDDGSHGFHGNTVDLLRKKTQPDGARMIYACGPKPMLKALADWAGDTPLQVSMEERMACGYGACVGCAVPIKAGNDIQYKRACKDGPVFDGRQVAW